MTIEISGQTIYELDQDGVNRWSANVQPGTGLDGYRQPDAVIDRVANRLYTADLYHERLVEMLGKVLNMYPWSTAVEAEARALLAALEAEKGGE